MLVLQDIFKLEQNGCSWAAGGYLGAIASAQATCGLLIGPAIAIGLAFGKGKDSPPEDNMDERNMAVRLVNELYRSFIKEFGYTECKSLIQLDFTIPGDYKRFYEEKINEKKCDVFLDFVMKKCISMAEEGKIK